MNQRAASKDAHKVLVIKFDDLGDFVLAMAAMKRIREAHPRARVTLLTQPQFAGLARASPYFDDVEALGVIEPMTLARTIKSARYDRVYDLDGGRRSAKIRRWAWPFRPAWFLTPEAEHAHLLERHAAMLRTSGIWPDAPVGPGEAPPPDLSWIAKKFPEQRPVAGATKPRPYVLMIPGGPEAARWPVDHFGKVAQAMRIAGYDVVIIGQPDESALARAIQRYDPKARDLTGRTDYATIAALGAKAALGIGNETGQTHLVAAAGAPVLALFSGASNPALTGPRGHVAVLQGAKLADLPPEQVLRAAASLAPMPAP